MNVAGRRNTRFVADARPRPQSWIASGVLHTGLALAFVLATVCSAEPHAIGLARTNVTRAAIAMPPRLTTELTTSRVAAPDFDRQAGVAIRATDDTPDVYTGDGPMPGDHSACFYCYCDCCFGRSTRWCGERDCTAYVNWLIHYHPEELQPLRAMGSFVSDALSDAGLSAVIPK